MARNSILFEIKKDNGKILKLISMGLLLFFGSIFALNIEFKSIRLQSGPISIFRFIILLLALPFFGILTIKLIKDYYSLPDPVIILTPDGFFDRRTLDDVVPWTNIESVREWGMRSWRSRQNMILLNLKNDAGLVSSVKKQTHFIMKANSAFGFDGLHVDSNMLDIQHSELLQAIQFFHTTYGTNGPQKPEAITPKVVNTLSSLDGIDLSRI